MDRRNFLSGIIGGITGAGLLVKASEAEILAFGGKEGQPISSFAQNKKDEAIFTGFSPVGEVVFNHKGLPIGVVRSMNINQIAQDITTYRDKEQVFMAGPTYVEYIVVSYGNVDINVKRPGVKRY